MAAPQKRKMYTDKGLQDLHNEKLNAPGVELIIVKGKFVGPEAIEVNGCRLTAEHVVVNTGSRAQIDSRVPGLVDAKPVDSCRATGPHSFAVASDHHGSWLH